MRVSEGTVIVTGASRGIGRATALAILARGGKVVAIARAKETLDALSSEAPDRVKTIVADLTATDAIADVAQRAVDAFGDVTGLVNCAGMARFEVVGAVQAKSLEKQIQLNLIAPLLLSQAVAPHLRGRGGAIVNVSSTLSEREAVGMTAYAATKAGLNSMTRSMALELADDGVRVNAVLPGVVDTDMIRAPRLEPGEGPLSSAEKQKRVEARLNALRARHPLGRLGRPEEVAEVIVELLDHEWQTGTLVTIDGGLSLTPQSV